MAEAVSLVSCCIRVLVEGSAAVRLFVVLDEDAKQDDESDLDAQQKRNVASVHQEMFQRHCGRFNLRSFKKQKNKQRK